MGSKPILVMDESTASVDKKTALAVEKNILEKVNSHFKLRKKSNNVELLEM